MTHDQRTKTWILDRWEGDHGVIEGLGPVPRSLLPRDLAEGDVLVVEAGPDRVTLTRDPDATARRRERLKRLRDSLNRGNDDNEVVEL